MNIKAADLRWNFQAKRGLKIRRWHAIHPFWQNCHINFNRANPLFNSSKSQIQVCSGIKIAPSPKQQFWGMMGCI
ncbi:hypothetical protein QUF90_16995 [Desulfococcaceae bacterium HSG9]|nr:hypothetical protein [Desulfococcaceae bacterium HSG9]